MSGDSNAAVETCSRDNLARAADGHTQNGYVDTNVGDSRPEGLQWLYQHTHVVLVHLVIIIWNLTVSNFCVHSALHHK